MEAINNTIRVISQERFYTFGAVTRVTARLHNLCMAKPKKRLQLDHVAICSGERIRKAREAHGWTQKEMAVRTGWVKHRPSQDQKSALSPSRIANFEQGTRRVGHEEAQILATLFVSFPAPYWMGVLSEQEAAVIAAMRRPAAPLRPPQETDRPSAQP